MTNKIALNLIELQDLYWNENLSFKSISKRLGMSPTCIRLNMIRYNIPRRESTRRDIVKPKKGILENLYRKGLSSIGIGKKFDVHPNTILKWMKEYNIPRRYFKYQKFPFSKNLGEKAYLIGLRLGDLYVQKWYRQVYAETTTTHSSMINLFYNVFQNYGEPQRSPKFNKKTSRYEWRVNVFLDKSFKFLVSKRLTGSIDIIDGNNFYDFLAGFFDAEGCLHIYDNHGYVGLSWIVYNSRKTLLDIIAAKLNQEGFHTKFHIIYKNEKIDGYFCKKKMWALALYTNEEVRRLLNHLPIRHDEKLRRANIALSVTNNRWQDIADEVCALRSQIKNETKQCVTEAVINWKVKHSGGDKN